MPLGNFFADALRSPGGKKVLVDFAVMAGGDLRGDRVFPAGNLTHGDLTSMHPYGNSLYTLRISGKDLRDAMEEALKCYEDVCGPFLQVSGFHYSFDPSLPALSRVVSLTLPSGDPIGDTELYTLAVGD